jgi:NAD(P)-dependent dehydrogenase (short-subunit alcohol dehydrogenase family)
VKTVLIAGGAGDHGGAIARRLVADGWFAILADVDGPTAGIVADSLGAKRADAVELDVTDIAAVQRTVDEVVAKHGPVAALVNAAGGRTGAEEGPFAESDPATWREIVDLQLKGMINVTYAVLPQMIAAQQGGIVSLAAFEGLRGDPECALFSAAKAGVIVLSEMLVREVQPFGIRVNTIVPGNSQSLAKLGRTSDTAAVAEAVAFLLSDAADLTTGACLDVSGGWALH